MWWENREHGPSARPLLYLGDLEEAMGPWFQHGATSAFVTISSRYFTSDILYAGSNRNPLTISHFRLTLIHISSFIMHSNVFTKIWEIKKISHFCHFYVKTTELLWILLFFLDHSASLSCLFSLWKFSLFCLWNDYNIVLWETLLSR